MSDARIGSTAALDVIREGRRIELKVPVTRPCQPLVAASMPSNWPELSLALGLALVVAYVVTSFLGRRIEGWLRALVPDERERYLVDRPQPVIRGLLFPRHGRDRRASGAAAGRLPLLRHSRP